MNQYRVELCYVLFGQYEEDLLKLLKRLEAHTFASSNNLLCRFADRTIAFTLHELVIDNCRYSQFIAVDVSEIDRLLLKQNDTNAALKQTNQRLMRLNQDIEALSKEQELLRYKQSVHDEMGSRVTLLYR